MRPCLSMLEVQKNGMREGKVERRSDGKCMQKGETQLPRARGFFRQLSRNEMLLFKLIPYSRCSCERLA